MPVQPLNTYEHTLYFADICTASTVTDRVSNDGKLIAIHVIPLADVTTADNTFTINVNGGASVSGWTLTIDDADTTTGAIYSFTAPAAGLSVTEGQRINVVSAGEGSGTVPAVVQMVYRKLTA